jgi:hypothetical protein
MLLALRYPWRDIRNAWLGARTGDRRLRANAQEYMEQVLKEPLRTRLRPLLGDSRPGEAADVARRHYGLDLRSEADVLRHLIAREDPWLRACATYYAATDEDASSRELAVARRDDPALVVREAAALTGT